MIRRFLLASALLITGTIVAAPSAFAETQALTFDGTINQACAFGNSPTGGGISVTGTTATSLTIAPVATSVTCNYAANLSVGAPVANTGTLSGTPTSSVTASGATLATTTTSNSGTPIVLVTGETETLAVNMAASNGGNVVPAGNYNYTVTLTVAP